MNSAVTSTKETYISLAVGEDGTRGDATFPATFDRHADFRTLQETRVGKERLGGTLFINVGWCFTNIGRFVGQTRRSQKDATALVVLVAKLLVAFGTRERKIRREATALRRRASFLASKEGVAVFVDNRGFTNGVQVRRKRRKIDFVGDKVRRSRDRRLGRSRRGGNGAAFQVLTRLVLMAEVVHEVGARLVVVGEAAVGLLTNVNTGGVTLRRSQTGT